MYAPYKSIDSAVAVNITKRQFSAVGKVFSVSRKSWSKRSFNLSIVQNMQSDEQRTKCEG